MKTIKNQIILEDSTRYTPTSDGVDYVDTTGMNFHIPMPLLVRLYEGAKYGHEKSGGNWKEFCDSLFREGEIE